MRWAPMTGATNLVAGDWRSAVSAATYDRHNPASTDDSIGRFAESGLADVDEAVKAAATAQPEWQRRGAIARGQVLAEFARRMRAHADDLATCLTREEGKPLAEAKGEVLRSADVFDYFAAEASRPVGMTLASYRPNVRIQTAHYPVGVVAIITPFNFPTFIPALKLGPALLAGNSVIWKPAPATPATGMMVTELLRGSGVPDGVIGYLTGTTAELGAGLVDHPGVDAISFTGSTAVGLAIGTAAARRHARVQQEMGGKNAMVVLADCDLDRAVRMAAESAFGGSGQKCTAAGRILVERKVLADFAAGLTEAAGRLRVGNGLDAGVDLGPVVDAAPVRRIGAAVEDAIRQGAKVAYDPAREPAWDGGHFVGPTVVTDVAPGMRLFDDETFGPVAVVTAVDDIDEAIAMATSSYGLTSAIHTSRLSAVYRFAERVPVGVVNVNQPTTGVEPHAPFGGVLLSGSPHRELGPAALDFYTRGQTQVIAVD
ncbi:MAG TPA: aldehyde dehydrogenase family protein [Pseudonocardiaceae bacterium]